MNIALVAAPQAAADSMHADRDDPVTRLFEFVFQQPPWLMWGGVVLGGLVALATLWWLWSKRPALRDALQRTPWLRLLLPLGIASGLAVAAVAGMKSFHFMKTDRRFCTGCHVFVAPGHAMVAPGPGAFKLVAALAPGHDTLQCAECHESGMVKQATKMLYWMSGVRDSTMPYRAPVARNACDLCHGAEQGDKIWQAVAATAGHRAHLEADSIQLRSKAECLTCHAEMAHRFEPTDQTCIQQGCHLSDSVQINLGRMSDQAGFHCVLCHQFSREVPRLASLDSARTVLRRPGERQCTECHGMQQRLAKVDFAKDPHGGSCAMCHNPHTNVKPKDALTTCADAGCHSDWRTVPFHTGSAHRRVARRCETCHQPHAARANASDCAGCHRSVPGLSPTGGRRRRP